MADLHYFPFYAKDWLSSSARQAMSPAQRGAYIDLLAFAWGNGDSEPCLDSDPLILAGLSGLGKQWAKLSPLILAQFAERDGLLYNAKLSAVWEESQERHGRAVANGKKGGRPKKPKQKPAFQSASEKTGETRVLEKQSESSQLLVEPTALTSRLSPEALGVETPRPAERPVERVRVSNGRPDKLSELIDRVAAGFRPKVPT